MARRASCLINSRRLRVRASEEFSDCVIAEVELIRQVEARYRRQGDYPVDRMPFTGKSQSKMTTGGVSQQDHARGVIEMRAGGFEAADNIFECARPATAWFADAPVFQARHCQAGPCQRGAGVARMRQVISRAPESTMNHHDRAGESLSFCLRLPQVKKLAWFGAVGDSIIGTHWRQSEKVALHRFQLTRISSPENLTDHS